MAAALDRLFYVVAAFVLASGVVQCAYFAAGAWTHPNTKFFLACLFFFPLSVVVTGAEFLVLARGGRRRIEFAGSLLRVLAIAALFPLISSLPELMVSLLQGERVWGFAMGLTSGSVATAAAIWAAAWLHVRFARPLPPDEWDLRFSLREAGLLCPLVGVFLVLTLYFGQQSPRFERNTSNVAAAGFSLPKSARKLTYYRANAAAPPELEFDIPEADFVAWFERRQGAAASLPADAKLQTIATPISLWQRVDDDHRHSNPVTMQNGLVYFWTEDGRRVVAAYDRDSQRAYFRCPGR